MFWGGISAGMITMSGASQSISINSPITNILATEHRFLSSGGLLIMTWWTYFDLV